MSDETIYTDEQLVYAATARCQCGAGYAYPRHTTGGDGVFSMASAWECSDILTGRAIPEGELGAVTHSERLPFAFYSVKSEEQSVVRLGGFMTTRPGGKEAFEQAKAAWDMSDKAADALRRDELGKAVRAAWVAYCQETGDTKPAHIAPWDDLSEWDKEANRRIAEAVKREMTR